MSATFRQLSPSACKTYLLGVEGSPEVVLVDPVLDCVEDCLEELDREGLRLSHVIDTHSHADHISAGPKLMDETGCEYVMHSSATPRCATKRLQDGSRVRFGKVEIEILHTPGHTKDSITLVLPDRLLTGDTLLLDDGGAGRDDLPGGNSGEHWDSLQKLRGLPGHLVVHPGHEYRDRQPSSLARQKKTNPHLRSASREAFIHYIEGLHLGPAEWMREVLRANASCARELAAAWIPRGVPACEVGGTAVPDAGETSLEAISARDLQAELAAGAGPVLVDVREASELDGPLGRLDGILHIPIRSLQERLAELEEHRTASLVTVCRSGRRSRTATQILVQAGFAKVRLLIGGMEGWRHAGF